MSQTINAIYEDGVLKPLEHLVLGEHQRVRIVVEPQDSADRVLGENADDPLSGVRVSTGIADLAEHFDDYRLGRRER